MAQMEENVLVFKIEDSFGVVHQDTAKSMSMVNRKLYRQQGLWQILGVVCYADVLDNDPDVNARIGLPYTVAISGAPRTWVTRNALVKAFAAWKDQQNSALRAAGSSSLRPRWEDFKVWLTDTHRTGTELTPISGHMFGNDDLYQTGEWVRSQLVWEDVDAGGLVEEHTPQFCIMGPNNMPQTVGLIDQYGDSRALPHSPDPVTPALVADNIYTQSHDALAEQMEEVIAHMSVDNNNPPYEAFNYPGGDSNGIEPLLYGFVASTTGATKGRKTTMNGFACPNGVMEIQYNLDVPSDPEAPTRYSDPELWIQLVVGRRSDY